MTFRDDNSSFQAAKQDMNSDRGMIEVSVTINIYANKFVK